MAVDIADIEGFDEAEAEQEEIEVGGDFAPRLHNKDKERMAEANVPFTLTKVDYKVSEPNEKFKRKVSKDGVEPYYWDCTATCDVPLVFAPVQGTGGRDGELKIEKGEEFSFILSGIAKREPVMRKLYDLSITGGSPEIKGVCFKILEYMANGTPILSLGKWKEGGPASSSPVR